MQCSKKGCDRPAKYTPRVKTAKNKWQPHKDKAVCAGHAEFVCAEIAKASGEKEPAIQLIPV